MSGAHCYFPAIIEIQNLNGKRWYIIKDWIVPDLKSQFLLTAVIIDED
jgi:hypothetical protein